MGLARDIEKAYARDDHLQRTRLAPDVLESKQAAFERRLKRFFKKIAPKVADAAAKRLRGQHG